MTNKMASARTYAPGIGFAVADRTINRILEESVDPKVILVEMPRDDGVALDDQIKRYCKENDILMSGYFVRKGGRHTIEVDIIVTRERRRETWGEVARRVAIGNALLEPGTMVKEFDLLHPFLNEGSILLSGRHLQHGDEDQPGRNIEVYTNCATAAASFLEFYLLLNGCFRAGTLVKMANGERKRIEDIVEGDEVVSFNEDLQEFVVQPVERLNINKPKPMVRVRTANGEEIVCTLDHKFLTNDGEWVEAQYLAGREVVQHV